MPKQCLKCLKLDGNNGYKCSDQNLISGDPRETEEAGDGNSNTGWSESSVGTQPIVKPKTSSKHLNYVSHIAWCKTCWWASQANTKHAVMHSFVASREGSDWNPQCDLPMSQPFRSDKLSTEEIPTYDHHTDSTAAKPWSIPRLPSNFGRESEVRIDVRNLRTWHCLVFKIHSQFWTSWVCVLSSEEFSTDSITLYNRKILNQTLCIFCVSPCSVRCFGSSCQPTRMQTKKQCNTARIFECRMS